MPANLKGKVLLKSRAFDIGVSHVPPSPRNPLVQRRQPLSPIRSSKAAQQQGDAARLAPASAAASIPFRGAKLALYDWPDLPDASPRTPRVPLPNMNLQARRLPAEPTSIAPPQWRNPAPSGGPFGAMTPQTSPRQPAPPMVTSEVPADVDAASLLAQKQSALKPELRQRLQAQRTPRWQTAVG